MRLIQMSSVKPHRWFTRLFARTAEKPRVSPYHAVSIRCGKNACQAALDKLGERHLSAEAALLPLDQCDRPDQCECRFQHYDDRRGKSRRRSDQGLSAQTDSERIERRNVKDRRAENIADEAEPFSVHEDSYYEHVGDTIRAEALDASEMDGVDPYNSGSFDKSKSWGSKSGK
jgi:hypothetical protein